MQKHVNLVDLVKSFPTIAIPTNIYLQNLASIQKRTSPIKFAHLAEESDNGSVSNLSTKAAAAARAELAPNVSGSSRRPGKRRPPFGDKRLGCGKPPPYLFFFDRSPRRQDAALIFFQPVREHGAAVPGNPLSPRRCLRG